MVIFPFFGKRISLPTCTNWNWMADSAQRVLEATWWFPWEQQRIDRVFTSFWLHRGQSTKLSLQARRELSLMHFYCLSPVCPLWQKTYNLSKCLMVYTFWIIDLSWIAKRNVIQSNSISLSYVWLDFLSIVQLDMPGFWELYWNFFHQFMCQVVFGLFWSCYSPFHLGVYWGLCSDM